MARWSWALLDRLWDTGQRQYATRGPGLLDLVRDAGSDGKNTGQDAPTDGILAEQTVRRGFWCGSDSAPGAQR